MGTGLKVFFGVVLGLVALWVAAVRWFTHGEPTERLQTPDTLQAGLPLLTDTLLPPPAVVLDSVKAGPTLDTVVKNDLPLPKGPINTKSANPAQVVAYAKTLLGVPYRYGSTDPQKGFDCSGFITHVFNNFGVAVPRSSIDFTHVGTEVSAAQAKAGDLILFTGTDSADHFVGHMGIVVENHDSLRFIHSSSGKANGVTITPLNKYYQGRYVKTIRIFR